MSHFLDRLTHFTLPKESFANGHGVATGEDRTWEDAYRNRWSHDKIVRSTHGVNCTGSCSWKIYVKGGIVTWETQQTDYPRTRADLPNHEPRGCARGASYSWYLYSANRLKYPMVRGRLLERWRAARKVAKTAVDAWASIVEDPAARRDYQKVRGMGGFVRSSWDEVNELIAAANVYTIKTHGPDRVIGFSPIPAMSMVSYAAGSRYLSLIGGVCMSFYDWYCDLPPASPQIWGEQTDVPESADWYNSTYLIAWGSNVPQTRTPDAHFFTEVRYKGAKTVAVTPDYSEVAKLADLWLHPKQGTDAALAMAMGHVVLKEFYFNKRSAYFDDYARRYTDLPLLLRLDETTLADGSKVMAPDRYVRATDFADKLGQDNNPEWKSVAFDASGKVVVPNGSIGFRWGAEGRADVGKWNLEAKEGRGNAEVKLKLSVLEDDQTHEVVEVAFPYFGGVDTPHFPNNAQQGELNRAKVPAVRMRMADGSEALVATVFDLQAAQYGIDRGLGSGAADFNDDAPYTPAWQEKDHRRAARPGHHGRPAVRRQRRQDAWQVDGHHRRGDEPLVPRRHELPRRDQPADDVRLHRPERRRLGALRRAGEAAPADRLDRARLRARLDPAAAPAELDLVLLRAHRPVALREARGRGSPVAAGRPQGLRRQPDRLQRARRAHGLAAERAAAEDQSAAGGQGRAGRRHRPEGLRRAVAEGRQPADDLRGSGHAAELAAQPVRVALQPPGLERQGPRVLLQAPARHRERRAGQGPRRRRRQADGGRLARAGARGQARPARDARLPHDHDVPVQRHRAADGELVREERPQHHRHAPVHPSAVGSGGPGVAGALRLGDLQGLREDVQRGLRRPPRRREGGGADAADARHAGGAGAAARRARSGRRGSASWCRARPRRRSRWSSATTRMSTSASPRSAR